MTTALPTVSVVMRAPRERERLRALLAPLLLDRATLEVLVDGSDEPGIGELGAVTDARVRPLGGDRRGWGAGADAVRGEIVLWLDAGVFATEGLVSAPTLAGTPASRAYSIGRYAPCGSTSRRCRRSWRRRIWRLWSRSGTPGPARAAIWMAQPRSRFGASFCSPAARTCGECRM